MDQQQQRMRLHHLLQQHQQHHHQQYHQYQHHQGRTITLHAHRSALPHIPPCSPLSCSCSSGAPPSPPSLSPFSLPPLVSTASLSSLSPVSRLPSLLSACSTTHSLSREEGSLSSPLSCSCSSCAPPSPLPPCLSHGSFSALARLFLRLYPRLPDLSPAPLLMCGRLLKRFQHRHRHQLVVLAMEVYELTNLGGCIHASLTTHLHPCLCVGG